MESNSIKIAIIQLLVGENKTNNLNKAEILIRNAKQMGAEMAVLPECFNSPYLSDFFPGHAESIPDGATSLMLSKAAAENKIFIVGGSIPEIYEDKICNTCTVWNVDGKLIAKYRKVHLFDADIPKQITFRESDFIAAGNEPVTFGMKQIKIGLGICHDIKFDEFAKIYRLKGCQIIIYPSAFNMSTGSAQWEILQRTRALDNQLFVVGASPARGDKGYIAWGYSQVSDPWGTIVGKLVHTEDILFCELDISECDKARQQLPLLQQRREDIYKLILL